MKGQKLRRLNSNLCKPRADCCQKCGTHFKKGKVKLLWNDVAECQCCGNVWVLESLREFEKWSS